MIKTLLWKWYFWLNEIKPTLDLVICPFSSFVGVVLLLLVLLLNKLVIPSTRSPNRKLLLFDILTSGSLREPSRSLKDLFPARMIRSLCRAQCSLKSSQLWNTINQKCILSCHWFTKLQFVQKLNMIFQGKCVPTKFWSFLLLVKLWLQYGMTLG